MTHKRIIMKIKYEGNKIMNDIYNIIKKFSCRDTKFIILYLLQNIFSFFYNVVLLSFPLICFIFTDNGQAVGISFLCIIISSIVNKFMKVWFDFYLENKIVELDGDVLYQLHAIPYETFEDIEKKNKIDNIIFSIKNQRAVNNFFENLSFFVQNIFQIFILLFIMTQIHYLFGIICLLELLLNYLILKWNRKNETVFYEKIIEDNRKMGYYTKMVTETENIKDLFVYNGIQLMKQKVLNYLSDSTNLLRSLMKKMGRYDALVASSHKLIIMFIYLIALYIYFIRRDYLSLIFMVISCISAFGSVSTAMLKYGFETFQMAHFLIPYIDLLKKTNLYSEKTNTMQLDMNNKNVIEFRKVSYKYPKTEKWIVKDLSFVIKDGEFVSIVGDNGAGKSTILKLLLGLLKPTFGEIYIKGVNIAKFNENQIFSILNVIFQDFVIFPDTLEENILLGRNYKQQDYENLIKKLGLDTIRNDSIIGLQYSMSAIELSGGQNQKIAIARALVGCNECLIMDEPTAALDPIIEKYLLENVLKYVGSKTKIIISHRLSTCVISDKILLIQDGKVTEVGTHMDLMDLNGVYSQMFKIQKELYYGK